METHRVSKKNVLALAYCKELNWILAAGAEGVIKVISLARPQVRDETDPLPTALHGHTDKITALVVLKNYVAASGGHDRQIRFWDLHTMVRCSGIRTSGRCQRYSPRRLKIVKNSFLQERYSKGQTPREASVKYTCLLQTEIESGRKEEAHQAPICRCAQQCRVL